MMFSLLALQAALPLSDMRFDLAIPPSRLPVACEGRPAADEVVVCGGRRRSYRLPLRDARRAMPAERARGEAPAAADVLAGSGRCGLFAGERRCTTKAEAAEFGYGGGRDPITVLTKVAKTVAGRD